MHDLLTYEELRDQADQLREDEAFKDAFTLYQKAFEHHPNSAESLKNLGRAYQEIGDLTKAESCYRQAINEYPDYWPPYHNLANIMKDSDRFEEAEKFYKLAIEKSAGNAIPYVGLGNLFSDMQQYKKAQQCYNRGLEIDPDNWMLRYNQAICFREQQKYERAIYCCENLIDSTPQKHRSKIYANLARCYSYLQEYEKAIIYWNLVIEAIPPHKRFYQYHSLAWLYERLEQPETAFQYCLKASESTCVEPDECDRLKGLYEAVSFFGSNNVLFQHWMQYLLEYILSHPTSDIAHYFLAIAYTKKGEYKKAGIYAKKASHLNPFHPRSYYLLANAYYGQGDIDQCLKVLKKMLEIDPLDYFEAHQALAYIYRKQGRLKKATQLESRLESLKEYRSAFKEGHIIIMREEVRFTFFKD